MRQIPLLTVVLVGFRLQLPCLPMLRLRRSSTKRHESAVPIPPSEKALETIVAEPYFKVSDKLLQLEGPSFDRDGNLIFVDVFGGRVFKLTPDKQLSVLLPEKQTGVWGTAIS